jgi:hypothetical protein
MALIQQEGDSDMAKLYTIARILTLIGCGYVLLGLAVPWLPFINDGASACYHRSVETCLGMQPIYTAVTMSLWQYAHTELAFYLALLSTYTFEALAASAIPYVMTLVAGILALRNTPRPLPMAAWILCLLLDLGSFWMLGLEARLFAISKGNPLYWQHFPQNPLSLIAPFVTALVFLFLLVVRRPSFLLRRGDRQPHAAVSSHA